MVQQINAVSTMDSCQREQAIEPSATMNDLECSSCTPSSNASLSHSKPTNSTEPNETPINKKKRKVFVPETILEKKRKPEKMLTLF